MSVDTKITITCNRCGKKSTPDNYEQFCSKVNLPSSEHFNNFTINTYRNTNTGIRAFGIEICIDEDIDLCPICRRWVNKFFDKQLDKIKSLLEQEWKKKKKG